MFNNKKSLRALIVMCTLMVALIINGIFTLGSTRNNPITAWQSNSVTEAAEAEAYSYVVLKVDKGDISVSDDNGTSVYMWVNLGTIQQTSANPECATIKVASKASNTDWDTTALNTVINIKKGVDTSAEQYQYSWYGYEFTSSFKTYWKVATQDSLQINEIVFTNKDGEVLSTTLAGANERELSASGAYYTYKFYPVENLPETSTAGNICDEQETFKQFSNMSKKYNLTKNEAVLVNASLSLLNGDGLYVDKSDGAFGVELVALGISVFGVNTLGVRIIPYIFFILTVFMLFAFGNRLFGDSDMGILFAVFYLLAGLGLSVASAGGVIVIAVFFTVLALFFMHMFYTSVSNYIFGKTKHTFRAGSTAIWVPIILSAFAFALAVNCTPSVLFSLPALIAMLVFGVIRAKKVYKYNTSIAEFEDEKVKNVKQYRTNSIGSAIIFVLSYFLFTFVFSVLFYGINDVAYTSVYANTSKNLLTAIAAQFKDACFGVDGVTGEFIKWIGGAGKTLVYSGTEVAGKFTNVYLSMNIAVQAIALFSFIVLTGYVIVQNFFVKNNAEGKKLVRGITLPYVVLTAGFIFSWLMFAFVKGATVYSYVLASTFILGFIPLGYKCFKLYDDVAYTVKNGNGKVEDKTKIELGDDDVAYTVKGKEVMQSTVIMWVALALAAVFFCLGYLAFVGIEIPTVAANILFGWWMF